MTVTQRGTLSPEQIGRLKAAQDERDHAQESFVFMCVDLMAKSSVREVARITGLSTNTLQRWKREAKS